MHALLTCAVEYILVSSCPIRTATWGQCGEPPIGNFNGSVNSRATR